MSGFKRVLRVEWFNEMCLLLACGGVDIDVGHIERAC